MLAKPNTVKAFTKFECKIYILTEDEGGRKKPFSSKYQYVTQSLSRQARTKLFHQLGWSSMAVPLQADKSGAQTPPRGNPSSKSPVYPYALLAQLGGFGQGSHVFCCQVPTLTANNGPLSLLYSVRKPRKLKSRPAVITSHSVQHLENSHSFL